MKHNASRLGLGGPAALLCIGILTGCDEGRPVVPGDPAPSTTQAAAPASVETRVARVIDGDTIAVAPVEGILEPTGEDTDEHIVRVLGIDAPEMNHGKAEPPECGAQAATDRLEQTLPVGMPIIVAYDAEADRTDRYGRSLAYVTTRGGTDAGLQQVASGLASAWHPAGEPQPQRYDDYQKAERIAQGDDVGAWRTCGSLGR